MTTLSIRALIALHSLLYRDDERGQTLAEYGLIIAVMAVATVVASVVFFRSAIIGSFNNASNCLGTGAANVPNC